LGDTQCDIANRVESFRRENVGATIVLSADYTYYNNDLVDTVTFGNGSTKSYEYDAAHRVTAIEYMTGANQLLRLVYTYDDRNLVTHIDEYEGGVDVGDVHFVYDERGRLTSEIRTHAGDLSRSYNLAYEYDQAGNRIKKTDHGPFGNDLVTTYHYDYENTDWESDYNQLMWSETCQTSGGMFGMMGPMGPGGGGGGPCVDVSKTYYYYNDEGNVTNVFTENLAPVGGEKRYSATALVYAKNNRTVTFAVGEEWTDETDYEAVWGREYRYDQARARYLRTVLDPVELNNGGYVGEEIWSQYGERSERKRAATGKASRDARVRPATCPEEASTMRVTGGRTKSTPTTPRTWAT
jgi:YD repeat-containing protein